MSYALFLEQEVHAARDKLPGHMRQRVRREIAALADNPQPANSRQLQSSESEHTLWRLRLDRWRIVYLVTEEDAIVDVLAVRRRPPYDYGDLSDLLEQLPDDTTPVICYPLLILVLLINIVTYEPKNSGLAVMSRKSIPVNVARQLWAGCGGYCQNPQCNRFLFASVGEDSVRLANVYA